MTYVGNTEEKQRRIEQYLEGRKFTKTKYIERALGITRVDAGRILSKIGWKRWGGKGCGNKTYVRPEQ